MTVHRNKRRLAALLLAACMALGLTACGGGGKDKDNAGQLSGKVYVPSFVDINMDVEDVMGGCSDGENLYLLAQVKDGEREETYTDPDTGKTESYTVTETHPAIFRMPLDGGTPEELTNFKATSIPEDAEGGSSINSIRAGTDGTLWVEEYSYIYNFNLPEGFDGTDDEKWNYFEDSTDTQVFRQIDSTGSDLNRIELTGLAEKLEVDYTGNINFDNDGNIYTTNGEDKLFVLDKDQNVLFTLEGERLWGDMVLLGDGTMGFSVYVDNEETGSYGYRLRTVDVANQSWGKEYPLPQNAGTVYTGGGDYLFYYQNNDSVYGLKAGAEEGEKLFSWLDSDIDRSNISFFTFLNDGRVAALSREWDWSTDEGVINIDLAVLTAKDRSELPEKTTLTYATMYLGYQERNDILEFNKTSDKYRIEVRDYSEYNTETDNSAGLTKLNTELIAGNIPDMMSADTGLPLRQYGAKGILEDLWPFIENDTEIGGRAGLMEHVLETAQQDGKLYQVFSTFYIQSCLGASRAVGDSMSWTLADLQAALAGMPEGCTIFGDGDTKDGMLSQILALNMDAFVEWEKGECHFDSPSFKSLLEFCNSFPVEFDWESVDWENYQDEITRMANGAQLLSRTYLSDFTELQMYKKVLDGDVTYVGYPMEDGSVGSSFNIGSGYAMTSACKDKEGAWSFMRQVLLPKADEAAERRDGVMQAMSTSGRAMAAEPTSNGVARYSFGGFPVNKSDFDKYMESAMTVAYETDENGEQVLDDNGEPVKISQYSRWMGDGETIDVYAATQEEVDQVMALYNAITTTYNYDQRIYDIIKDMAGAYFAGDRGLDDTATQIQSRVKLYMNEQL